LMPLLSLVSSRLPALWIVLGGIGLTVAIYVVHRVERILPFPGSSLLWYIPAVTLGLYFLSKADQLEITLQRLFPWAVALSGFGLALYLPTSLEALRGYAVNTLVYQFGHWGFSTALTIVVAALAVRVRQTSWRGPLEFLGRYSLQIYLFHPVVLTWLYSEPEYLSAFGLSRAMLMTVALALLVPLALARITWRLRTSALLFGR
jgi:peptidoglycan/LPS O-acetylase OafA/YrhL